jgi:hypothetical protein
MHAEWSWHVEGSQNGHLRAEVRYAMCTTPSGLSQNSFNKRHLGMFVGNAVRSATCTKLFRTDSQCISSKSPRSPGRFCGGKDRSKEVLRVHTSWSARRVFPNHSRCWTHSVDSAEISASPMSPTRSNKCCTQHDRHQPLTAAAHSQLTGRFYLRIHLSSPICLPSLCIGI